jgi:hypothetical protein
MDGKQEVFMSRPTPDPTEPNRGSSSSFSLPSAPSGTEALTRRDLLLLSAATLTSLSLFGCGGGGGSTSSNVSLPGRTPPTGNLTHQILQYSNSADRLSSLWQAQSANINAMTSFASTRASRDATTSWVTYVQGTYYGLLGIESIYEIFARQFVEFDNIGYLADQITTQNKLQGTNALNNPQWLLAMMERGQQAITTLGYILEALQTNGLGALIQTVRETTDPTGQLVFYGVLTEIFNGWITNLAARVEYPVDPTWLLDVGNSAPVTNASLLTELDRVVPILNDLPFGPGFNQTQPLRSATTRETIADPKDVVPSVIGEILKNIQETLENPKTVKEILFTIETDLDNYTKRVDLNKTNISKFLLTNVAKEIAKDVIKKGIVDGFTKWKGKLAGTIADCVIEILDKSIDLAKYFSGTIATLEVLPLAIAFATLTTLQILAILQKLKECLDKIQMELPGRPPIILMGTITIDDYPPPVRIPFVKVVTGETDQIRAAKVVKGEILRRRREKPKLPVELKAIQLKLNPDGSVSTVRGTLTSETVSAQRVDANGNPIALPGKSAGRATTNLLMARSYEGVEVSVILLMIDLMNRFPDALTPSYTADGDGIDYSRSDLATLLRRETGSTAADVPGITAAQLLCTAPGYVPMQNAQPEDLTKTPSLATLFATTSFSPGGNIHVK